jgi:L-arabinonolactonase
MKVKVDCVLDIRAGLGECPVWCAQTRSLYWIDIYAPTLNRFDPATSRNRVWTMPETIGSVALCEGNAALVALKSGLYRFDLETEALTLLAEPEPDLPSNRLNDGRCDRQGRFWVGSMRDPPDPVQATGSLYCFNGRHCRAMAGGLYVANGLAFSEDGRTLYHSDSFASVRTIWAWDLDPHDGVITNRRLFVDTHGMPGRPDGGAVDSDGCYWTAAHDGWELVRFTPAGKVDRRISLPVAKPSMLAFGGDRLDVIYVTSIRPANVDLRDQPQAGSLFTVDAGIRGLPEPLFAG